MKISASNLRFICATSALLLSTFLFQNCTPGVETMAPVQTLSSSSANIPASITPANQPTPTPSSTPSSTPQLPASTPSADLYPFSRLIRVMTVGDSITDFGDFFRRRLGESVAADGGIIDFVGSKGGLQSLANINHEGYSGWTTSQVLENIELWATRSQPEVVTLMIGTNDVWRDMSLTDAAKNVDAIVTKVRNVLPNTQILVAKILPMAPAPVNVGVYNDLLKKTLQPRIDAGEPITLVDMNSGFVLDQDMTDGVHLNESGYTKMADRWLQALKTVKFKPLPKPRATRLAVMPLGDSITAGSSTGAYRRRLGELMTADGYKLDFVGSQNTDSPSLPDGSHEGHPGWRIDQISEQIEAWLETYQPDAITLMIGTNDMWQNYDRAGAPARLSALLSKIQAKSPKTHIFVGNIIPMTSFMTEVQAYNSEVEKMVKARMNAGELITFVDLFSGILSSDLSDGVHPTETGDAVMGDRFFSAIRSTNLP